MMTIYSDKNVTNIPLSIIVTNYNKIYTTESKTNFSDINDMLSICECSSYIPFLSGYRPFIAYNKNYYIDGGLYNIKHDKNQNNIHIYTGMWGRKFNFKNYLYLDYNSSLELYNLGWNDTLKNMHILDKKILIK